METYLYLIRHGETDWNTTRRIQGHSDIELNELGKKQAKMLATYMSSHTFSHVYTSDLKRAYETGKLLAEQKGITVQMLPTLRERCYGEWEGLHYEDIKEKFKDIKPHESLHGIESFQDMQKRANKQLTDLASTHVGESIVVVSHGGFINSFLHLVTEGKHGTGTSKLDNTGINLFCYSDNEWRVDIINQIDHLRNQI